MHTRRLNLIPATIALCDAETRGPEALGAALDADVPASWPPPVLEPDDVARIRRQLETQPDAASWTLHYILRRPDAGDRAALVGVAGYASPPNAEGVVEIGYAVAVEHQRQGYASEAVDALIAVAFANPRVRVIAATTYPSLVASIGVLEKTGFVRVRHDPVTDIVRFERARASR